MKRKNKTIFKVTCDTEELNVLADKKDYNVSISQGTTGEEMTYALVALLQVIMAHEEAQNNKFSANSFMNYLKILLDNSQIGVPEDD
jgi:hypothetical protein